MIKLDKAVVVEGKYDKIKLGNIIDAVIITTDGFSIFKNKEKISLIRLMAKKSGIIIMTDSDSAGMLIRSHLKGMVPPEKIINVYLPQILGREKRKSRDSAEGYLGLEGTPDSVIKEALMRAGVVSQNTRENECRITKADLMAIGLSGGKNSSEMRRDLMVHMGLPNILTANAFLEVINALYSADDFFAEVKKWRQESTKN